MFQVPRKQFDVGLANPFPSPPLPFPSLPLPFFFPFPSPFLYPFLTLEVGLLKYS